jgi:hypothetical protein
MPTGKRREFSLEDIGIERWQPMAYLAGIVFPRVDAALCTTIQRLSDADAFVKLVRQSP